jgi:uncharacterized Zn finger protein (UPF0148 family)
MQSIDCPNCGAVLHDDGWAPSVTCTYCSTKVRIPRDQPKVEPVPGRHPLQDERDDLAKRIAQLEKEWNARIANASDPPRFTAMREEALAPMRVRLKHLDDRISGRDADSPRERLRALEGKRREITAYMDKVLAHVENVRNSGASDVFAAPLLGCIPTFVVFLIVSLIATKMYTEPERFDDPSSLLALFGTWIVATIVMWIVRVVRRKRRLALLTEARDAVIPDCQKQLDAINREIERLA